MSARLRFIRFFDFHSWDPEMSSKLKNSSFIKTSSCCSAFIIETKDCKLHRMILRRVCTTAAYVTLLSDEVPMAFCVSEILWVNRLELLCWELGQWSRDQGVLGSRPAEVFLFFFNSSVNKCDIFQLIYY